jgi:hypothetical protein
MPPGKVFMKGQSEYDRRLDESSAKLRNLSVIAHQLEIDILKFDENPEDTDLCVSMVQKILEAKFLSDQLVFHCVQRVRLDDERVADAIEMARNEVVTKILGVETDLNRIVNRSTTKEKPPARVLRLISA